MKTLFTNNLFSQWLTIAILFLLTFMVEIKAIAQTWVLENKLSHNRIRIPSDHRIRYKLVNDKYSHRAKLIDISDSTLNVLRNGKPIVIPLKEIEEIGVPNGKGVIAAGFFLITIQLVVEVEGGFKHTIHSSNSWGKSLISEKKFNLRGWALRKTAH